METSFGLVSLIPAFVTILVAVFTRKVALALFCGLAAGTLGFANWEIIPFFKQIWHYLVESFSEPERIYLVAFIMLIGGLLNMIQTSGAYDKFAEVLSRKINSPRKARLTTWFLSFFLFFNYN